MIGAKIIKVREMTDSELSDHGWDRDNHKSAIAIEFDSGDVLYPSKDPEGNDYGTFFGKDKDGNLFNLVAQK